MDTKNPAWNEGGQLGQQNTAIRRMEADLDAQRRKLVRAQGKVGGRWSHSNDALEPSDSTVRTFAEGRIPGPNEVRMQKNIHLAMAVVIASFYAIMIYITSSMQSNSTRISVVLFGIGFVLISAVNVEFWRKVGAIKDGGHPDLVDREARNARGMLLLAVLLDAVASFFIQSKVFFLETLGLDPLPLEYVIPIAFLLAVLQFWGANIGFLLGRATAMADAYRRFAKDEFPKELDEVIDLTRDVIATEQNLRLLKRQSPFGAGKTGGA